MTTTTTDPKPGIYRNVPMAEYHAWPAASNTALSWMRHSPAHCRAYMTQPFEDTEALAFGRAVHAAILEPDEFALRYVRPERCAATKKSGDRCTNTGTMPLLGGGFVCGIHGNHPDISPDDDRETLTPANWDACIAMRDSVRGMEKAGDLLDQLGSVEISMLWEDQETGVLCKARWDGYAAEVAGGTVIDLKSARDASREEFEKSIARYGYHRQGALYLEGAAAHGIEARHYALIPVEKTRPYAAALYRLIEPAIEQGADEVRVLLRRYAECLEMGEWPGLNGGEVVDIGLPPWGWTNPEDV